MQPKFLDLLGDPVQQFIRDVEEASGIGIEVIRDPKQDEEGTTGQGKLAVNIEAQRIQLFAPTTGYFPDGAVRHEVLHVWRFHVGGVPKLALDDDAGWDKRLSDALTDIDNAIEHVVIVPVELQFHPERRDHWEAVMRKVWSELPDAHEGEWPLAVCLHWTFLRHVLPDSHSIAIAKDFAIKNALLEMANAFADQFISVLDSKEEIVRHLFRTFPELPRDRAALEYINNRTGTRQEAIPI